AGEASVDGLVYATSPAQQTKVGCVRNMRERDYCHVGQGAAGIEAETRRDAVFWVEQKPAGVREYAQTWFSRTCLQKPDTFFKQAWIAVKTVDDKTSNQCALLRL